MPRPALRLALGLALEAAAFATIATLGDAGARIPLFLALFTAASAGFLAAVHAARTLNIAVRRILLIGVLLRLPLLPLAPSLSDDAWRYLHDGRAQHAGLSPFAYPPAAPETTPFRGPGFERINHPDLVTIYPPFAQLGFRLAATLGSGILAWKLVLLAAEAALILLLAAALRRTGRSLAATTLYAWHPLAIIEIAGSAHLEPLALAPLIGALAAAAYHRPLMAGAALGLSIAAKYLALPLIPFLDRQNMPRVTIGVAAAVAAVSAPYVFAGPDIFGSLFLFGRTWESNAGIYAVLRTLVGSDAARIVVATLLVFVLLRLWHRGLDAVQAALPFVLATLLLSPVVHPWYLLWAVALLPLAPAASPTFRAALLWSLLVPLAYLAIPPFRAGLDWHVPISARLAQYLPVLGLLLTGLSRRTAALRSATPFSTPAR